VSEAVMVGLAPTISKNEAPGNVPGAFFESA
jgi:hypothetical protein